MDVIIFELWESEVFVVLARGRNFGLRLAQHLHTTALAGSLSSPKLQQTRL